MDEETVTGPEMRSAALRDFCAATIAGRSTWTLALRAPRRYVWYKSANAEEPRRGPPDEVE